MYKTLVTEGAPRQYYVFVIPIDSELSLKKAARAVGVKSLSMIPVKDITAVTGYVRGGCTALGMKKKYPTVIDSGAEALPEIVVSGGRLGCQIELAPADLLQAADASFADVAEPGGLREGPVQEMRVFPVKSFPVNRPCPSGASWIGTAGFLPRTTRIQPL